MNSTNRAEQGIAYLQEFLGDLVGQPLTVHESMESLLEQHAEHDPPLAEPIEVPELVTAHLDQHYKQVLDEPVPALNNKTPRECTQGGDRQRLIQSRRCVSGMYVLTARILSTKSSRISNGIIRSGGLTKVDDT